MAASGTEKPNTKCPVPMQDGTPCGREPHDDKGLCICHSKDPNKDRDAFNREIKAMLERKDYDFTGFVFLEDAEFVDRVFDGPVWFIEVTFHGNVNFFSATFQGDAQFTDATFQRVADFWGATFQGRVRFEIATFQGKASFCDATFQGDVDFGAATFQGYVDFWCATFQGQAHFVGVGDKWVFSREAGADFSWANLHQPEKVVFQHVFLGRARFLGADVRQVDFTDVQWAMRSGGRFAVWDELAPEGEGEEKDYALIGKLYRQLKHNYEEQRDPITAGDFHFGEMDMRRLSDPPKSRFWRRLKRNLSFLALYRWISGYGEDYILPLLWIVGVILGFAAAFAWISPLALQTSPSSGASQPVQGWWPHLLYSVMCFLLRGDKPFQPVHLAGHYLSVLEGIMGPPFIALFVLALNRRFKR